MKIKVKDFIKPFLVEHLKDVIFEYEFLESQGDMVRFKIVDIIIPNNLVKKLGLEVSNKKIQLINS